ncbi:flavin reductase family protein [Pararhodospirillum photometricum]|uniref:flavin reductase family protein n=1 Tax=Pararhodospirillum photometricum TaxID=1084 RepID=UPI0003013F86|nr:flavin reductase family protein [Pararhodospirillum photometricum]
MSVDSSVFRKTLGCFASGVTVVTARTKEGMPAGVTVSAFSSLSLDPPLVLFCLGRSNTQIDAFTSGPLCVSILSSEQRDVSSRFATKGIDRFAQGDLEETDTGILAPKGALARLECTVHQVVEGGDHLIIVALVEKATWSAEHRPLVYFQGAYQDIRPAP